MSEPTTGSFLGPEAGHHSAARPLNGVCSVGGSTVNRFLHSLQNRSRFVTGTAGSCPVLKGSGGNRGPRITKLHSRSLQQAGEVGGPTEAVQTLTRTLCVTRRTSRGRLGTDPLSLPKAPIASVDFNRVVDSNDNLVHRGRPQFVRVSLCVLLSPHWVAWLSDPIPLVLMILPIAPFFDFRRFDSLQFIAPLSRSSSLVLAFHVGFAIPSLDIDWFIPPRP
ncbi:hypothetical protein R1flu_025634 [Riccia fluitans]|uniref:Uncharacterized protein n=1 Tax=Riccia fluitans TaxID=41844 RepID=A0ABD1XYB3_9MARC